AIRTLRNGHRAMVGVCRKVDGALTDEAVCKDLRLARSTVTERHGRHVVGLRIIGSAMERDERRAPIFLPELITAVEKQPVGRVVGGKGQERSFGVRTATDGLSIAAILRRQHLLL